MFLSEISHHIVYKCTDLCTPIIELFCDFINTEAFVFDSEKSMFVYFTAQNIRETLNILFR